MERRTPVLATLTVALPDGREQLVSLKNGDSIRVGREGDNDIIIEESSVSRRHASFDCSSYGVVVTDLESLNGTFLNGVRLTSMKDLNSGDVLNIGAAKIVVQIRSLESLGRTHKTDGRRTMTAQLKPVSVSVLVVRAALPSEDRKQHTSLEIDQLLNRWADKIQDIVYRCGGRTDKNIEDTSVALWVGREPQVQAERALQAAQAVLDAAAKPLCLASSGIGDHIKLDVRAVIASGHGLAGAVGGSESEHGFTVLGDPLNAAFEMQSEIRRLGTRLLFDETTASLLPKSYTSRQLGTFSVAGAGSAAALFTI